MEGYLTALAFASLPALGNFAGGVLAEVLRPSRRMLSLALHAAAGIVLSVVAVELMPQAIEADPPWLIVLSFMLGGVFFVAMDKAIGIVTARLGRESAGPWVIWFGVAVDLFSDGVMVGTGATVALGLGLLLALGQVPADIPEGFATISNLRDAGVRRGMRLLLSAAFAAPIFLGATLGYWGMRGQPELYKLMLLTFTAGVLTTLVVEELIPEAHEGAGGAEEEPRLAALVFVGGFALFALISAYFELDQG